MAASTAVCQNAHPLTAACPLLKRAACDAESKTASPASSRPAELMIDLIVVPPVLPDEAIPGSDRASRAPAA